MTLKLDVVMRCQICNDLIVVDLEAEYPTAEVVSLADDNFYHKCDEYDYLGHMKTVGFSKHPEDQEGGE